MPSSRWLGEVGRSNHPTRPSRSLRVVSLLPFFAWPRIKRTRLRDEGSSGGTTPGSDQRGILPTPLAPRNALYVKLPRRPLLCSPSSVSNVPRSKLRFIPFCSVSVQVFPLDAVPTRREDTSTVQGSAAGPAWRHPPHFTAPPCPIIQPPDATEDPARGSPRESPPTCMAKGVTPAAARRPNCILPARSYTTTAPCLDRPCKKQG